MKNIIHWNKHKKMWTSHTYKSCTQASVILVTGAWTTETKPNRKTNPRGWIVTDHTNVIIEPSQEQLFPLVKTKQLFYDKTKFNFNIQEGTMLLFDSEGCFLIKR